MPWWPFRRALHSGSLESEHQNGSFSSLQSVFSFLFDYNYRWESFWMRMRQNDHLARYSLSIKRATPVELKRRLLRWSVKKTLHALNAFLFIMSHSWRMLPSFYFISKTESACSCVKSIDPWTLRYFFFMVLCVKTGLVFQVFSQSPSRQRMRMTIRV